MSTLLSQYAARSHTTFLLLCWSRSKRNLLRIAEPGETCPRYIKNNQRAIAIEIKTALWKPSLFGEGSSEPNTDHPKAEQANFVLPPWPKGISHTHIEHYWHIDTCIPTLFSLLFILLVKKFRGFFFGIFFNDLFLSLLFISFFHYHILFFMHRAHFRACTNKEHQRISAIKIQETDLFLFVNSSTPPGTSFILV